MGAENGPQKTEIVDRLLSGGASFSFVQAIRLILHKIASGEEFESGSHEEILEKFVRVRPELSLRFPGTDITSVEKAGKDSSMFRITATFLGLYGASSPLPSFYTEDLIEEFNEEKSIKRDFVDVINCRLYPVFFRIWAKYRLFYKICEENDPKAVNMIYSLLGLENEHLRSRIFNLEKYYRYTGLAIQFPRSAEGLETMIRDFFSLDSDVTVRQCVFRRVSIPCDQYSRLGAAYCTLGEDSVIGTTVVDISGKFRILIRGADAETLHFFLPDGPAFGELEQMVMYYVNQPLSWGLAVEVEGRELETARPGNPRWSHLGWNTWLFSGDNSPEKACSVLK
ncbi:MAG: type VI secretion system baseplate subunit TssG [Desulfobacteraceae bacterium]